MTTHPDAVRNAIADLVVARVDAGGAAGRLEFQSAASAILATLTFSATAFGAATGGVATANAITSDTNAVAGTTTKAVIKASDGAEVWTSTVSDTGGAGEIKLDKVDFNTGDTVGLTALTYTAPA